MLHKEQLIEQLMTTFGKTKVDQLSAILNNNQFDINELIDVTFHPDKTIAFRAAWCWIIFF
ncbi:hypothetical protein [Mucilaginibacter segetis]|uniref:Uncharacterized protein n=1 Tax=Mucilaginibacter segetis TaxID=2793071 RepID=A0A934PRU5_9SPHI|nr:hypothetical protein [Mucilaginibacter segetis]MBK0378944.1 hypothetical protein [Mucilaginibacter segetis]